MNRAVRLASAFSAAIALTLGGAMAASAGESPDVTEQVERVDTGPVDALDLSALDPNEEYSFVAVDAAGNDVATFSSSTGSSIVTPFATWGACGVFTENNKLVRTFSRVAGDGLAAGKSYLRCGSQAWGLRHIIDGHLSQWEFLAGMGGSSSWRTFADWAINQALSYPATVTYRSANDTYAYRTQIQIRDRNDRVVAVKYVLVSVARVSKNIITAYPQDK